MDCQSVSSHSLSPNELLAVMANIPPTEISASPSPSPSPSGPLSRSLSPSASLTGQPQTQGEDQPAQQQSDSVVGASAVKIYRPRSFRQKIFVNGYFMSLDKKSTCGKFNFWRCKRKHKCSARIHTKVNSTEIVKLVNSHVHLKATKAEIKFHNVDESKVVEGHVIYVNTVSDLLVRRPRGLRTYVGSTTGETEAAQDHPTPFEELQLRRLDESGREVVAPTASVPTLAGPIAGNVAGVSGWMQAQIAPTLSSTNAANNSRLIADVPEFMQQFFRDSNRALEPSPSASAPTEETNGNVNTLGNGGGEVEGLGLNRSSIANDPRFVLAFQLFKEVYDDICRIEGANALSSSTASSSTSSTTNFNQPTPFKIYVQLYEENRSEDEGIIFHHLVLPQRSVAALQRALEIFSGKICPLNIVEVFSTRANLIVSDEAIQQWANGRVFLLDTRPYRNGWKLFPMNENEG